MTATALPASASDITAEWLNAALSDSALTGGAQVANFDSEVIGEGTGFVGEVSRVSLTLRGQTAPGPTLVAKMPSQDDTLRNLATLFGFYEREVRFYQEIATHVHIRTPDCYYAGMDLAAGHFVLLLEDLSAARCGDQLASCSIDEAKLALGEVAKLHAAWWDSPRLKDFPWLPGLGDPIFRQMLGAMYQQSWPAFADLYKHQLPADVMEIGERLGAQFDSMALALTDRPRTIVHSDFRLDNMFFEVAGGESPFALIDWQLVQQSFGAVDVAYFLAGNFPPDVRRKHQTELLKFYHGALLEHGVSGYGYDQCLEDYRRALLGLLLFIVPNRENLDINDLPERGQALLNMLVERYLTAILDEDAGSFLAD